MNSLGEGEGLLPTLREAALRHGATEIGVCSADPFPDVRDSIAQRVATGLNGPLKLTYGDGDLATDIRRTHPWAESLVVLGLPYLPAPDGRLPIGDGEIARFATQDHYIALHAALDGVSDILRQAGFQAEAVFDDNSLVDRAAAQRAGVGWWGRNTMMIAPGVGPWMLLGSVVTDAPLSISTPMSRTCGTCFDCIPACPTGALDTPGVLDARKCLGTWLQSAKPTPHHLRAVIGARIYGCDDCLTSCPPGSRYLEGSFDPKGYRPEGAGVQQVDLTEALSLSDAELVARFPHFYVPKRDGKYLRRNALVALANTVGDSAPLVDALDDPSSVIRSSAAWAVGRRSPQGAAKVLRDRLGIEGVQEVRDELMLALLSVEFPVAHAETMRLLTEAFTHPLVRSVALIGSHASGKGGADSDLDLQVMVESGIEFPAGELGVGASAKSRRADDAVVWSWTTGSGLDVELAIVPTKRFEDLNPAQVDILREGVVSLHDRMGLLEKLRRRTG